MALILIWVILFFRLYSNCTASHPVDFSSFYDSQLFASSVLPWLQPFLNQNMLLFCPWLWRPTLYPCLAARDHFWGDRCVLTDPIETLLLLESFCFFFFFGDPRGKEWPARHISQAEATWCFEWKAFADWGLWQAGEAGAGVLSERFDTPSNSPLSLALVSKQYRSLNCSSAYSCCHTSSLLSH